MAVATVYTWEGVAAYLGISTDELKTILLSPEINEYCATSHVRRAIQVFDGITYADVGEEDGVGRNTVRRSIQQVINAAFVLIYDVTEG